MVGVNYSVVKQSFCQTLKREPPFPKEEVECLKLTNVIFQGAVQGDRIQKAYVHVLTNSVAFIVNNLFSLFLYSPGKNL